MTEHAAGQLVGSGVGPVDSGPSRSRYTAAITRAVRLFDFEPGVGSVYVPPSERHIIAERLVEALGAARVAPSDETWMSCTGRVVVGDWPDDEADAERVFRELNVRREWLRRRGVSLVLVLEPRDARRFVRHAPDMASVAATSFDVAFEPDPAVSDEEGRAALARWLDAGFGRLDLRGLMRSEREDVSFRVTEVYQALDGVVEGESERDEALRARGRERRLRAAQASHGGGVSEDPRGVDRVDELLVDAQVRAVLLGAPGSGKSFFLRWLASSAARAETFLGKERPLPVLVSLSSLQHIHDRPLLDELEERLLELAPAAGHVLRRFAARGAALLLLDGLDEVGDGGLRRRARVRVDAFARAFPDVGLVVTSRPAGYEQAPIDLPALAIAPLSTSAIGTFLERWMRLHAIERRGAAAAEEGAEEGRRLAADIAREPRVASLAQSPLLLTVIATIHRAGTRLPDQRVDLYAHATQVLVERWNALRSLSPDQGHASPLRAADAVRLLGPVGVSLVSGVGRGVVSEDALKSILARELRAGAVRGVGSADEAIAVFRQSLGLLVENAPGWFSFLHLTFVEYFAALELIRTGELERLVRDPARVFRSEWREVLLLAAGELGVVRADDARLRALVEAIVAQAASAPRGQKGVHPLLVGLLADDPALDEGSATALAESLVPRWWFDELELNEDSYSTFEVSARIHRGRWAQLIRARLAACYERPRQFPVSATKLTLTRCVLRLFDCDDFHVVEFALGRDQDVTPGMVLGWEASKDDSQSHGQIEVLVSSRLVQTARYAFELRFSSQPETPVLRVATAETRTLEQRGAYSLQSLSLPERLWDQVFSVALVRLDPEDTPEPAPQPAASPID